MSKYFQKSDMASDYRVKFVLPSGKLEKIMGTIGIRGLLQEKKVGFVIRHVLVSVTFALLSTHLNKLKHVYIMRSYENILFCYGIYDQKKGANEMNSFSYNLYLPNGLLNLLQRHYEVI